MTFNLLNIIRDAANNKTTLRKAVVYTHPKEDPLIHVALDLTHDESQIQYFHLVRMNSLVARRLAEDLLTYAELASEPRPAF